LFSSYDLDIEKEEKFAHEKEMKIHEDKMHKLNIQVKEFEVSYIDQDKDNNFIFDYYFRILIKNVVL
jgi:hypothetical protein